MSAREIETIRLGRPSYAEAYQRQLGRRAAVESGTAPNTLFLVEHDPVMTLGRNAHREHLLKTPAALEQAGIQVVEADRGGDVTYHGPGQLVAYPILDLRAWRQSIKWYLRALEEVLIGQLSAYGLLGERVEGLTGVWVGDAKVAAIGVGIHKWVTFHGIALNVNPDMTHFTYIVPCGIADRPVTSLAMLMDNAPDLAQAASDFERGFLQHFSEPPRLA